MHLSCLTCEVSVVWQLPRETDWIRQDLISSAAALAKVHQVLQWIGFGNQVHCDSICEEAGFESLKDLVRLSEKDIREMADGYEKHTQVQGRIPFGLRCIRLLIGVIHWVQDQDHCYRSASTGDIADANEFREIIDISIQHATLRKVEDDQVDMISKAADPGKFKDERKTTYPQYLVPIMCLSRTSSKNEKIQIKAVILATTSFPR